MSTKAISEHEIRLYRVLSRKPKQWFTHAALADESRISPRTARAYTLRYVKLGIVKVTVAFPGNRYQFCPKPGKQGAAYIQRLIEAEKVFA